jgi:TPR repeat protein
MQNWLRAAVMVVALGCAGPVMAGVWEDIAAADARGDNATLIRFIRPLAEQGDAGAQFRLGGMYDSGQGVPQDYAQALKLYRLAAQQDVSPQHKVFLGAVYENGLRVPQDYAEAVKWYRLAAEQNYPLAQDMLSTMYENGQGVPQDYILAHMWANLSAAGGSASGRRNRDIIAAMMTPSQIAEAQRLAREWKPTPAK